MLLRSLQIDGLLSFAPGCETIEFGPLNLIIGPNGSGKSNLLEIFEFLQAAPTSFASVIRSGGGIKEWIWKGASLECSSLQVTLYPHAHGSHMVYSINCIENSGSLKILSESIEEKSTDENQNIASSSFYNRSELGPHTIGRIGKSGAYQEIVESDDIKQNESVLSQRKDPQKYPELYRTAQRLSGIQIFREWAFGRQAPIRQPQPADLPNDLLLPDASNLGLIINRLEHTDAAPELNDILRRFLPRFQRVSTRVQGGMVQIVLHEDGPRGIIPATRLSDGTMRFLAMAALLLMPDPPPLICIEEPEMGLHPDAMILVAELLKKASERTQLIVTTHSEALVSAFSDQPESVLGCEHLGGTRLTRLDPDRLAYWLENYSLGEVWRIGELGGNP